MKETQIQKEILDYLLYSGIYAWRNNQFSLAHRSFKGMRGVSDIIAILPGGKFFGIEVKSANGKLSPQQKAFQAKCKELGAAYVVAKKIEDVKKVLDNL